MVKPSTIEKAVVNEHWVMAMHDELNQFKRNEVWELVPRPSKTNIIGTKWVFKNKLGEHGLITGKKVRLVSKFFSNTLILIYLSYQVKYQSLYCLSS